MYLMCVILGLFSALSRRVDALQISIIINIITDFNCNWRSDGVDMISESDGWKSATRVTRSELKEHWRCWTDQDTVTSCHNRIDYGTILKAQILSPSLSWTGIINIIHVYNDMYVSVVFCFVFRPPLSEHQAVSCLKVSSQIIYKNAQPFNLLFIKMHNLPPPPPNFLLNTNGQTKISLEFEEKWPSKKTTWRTEGKGSWKKSSN